MRARRLSLSGAVAGVAAAGLIASGCGGNVVSPVVDDVIRVAERPAIASPTPFRPTSPMAAPRSVLELPQVQARPRAVLPQSVSAAPADSEVVARFVVCEGAGFYLATGHLPTAGDWQDMLGGWALSQVPPGQAEAIGDELEAIAESPNPFQAAAQLSHLLGCSTL